MTRPLLIFALMVSPVFASDWPQWRGPLLNGSTTETNLKARFRKQTDLLWSTPLPGRSGATPVVWGEAIFVPSPDAQKNLLLSVCLRLRRRVVWLFRR